MRKRSRRRSRRRSSRRSRRNKSGLGHKIGILLICALVATGVWLIVGEDDDKGHRPEAQKLGLDQVAKENSEGAKAARRSADRSYLREASEVMKTLNAAPSNQRRQAEVVAHEALSKILTNSMSVKTRAEIIKPFNKLCESLFFSTDRNSFSETYIVKRGDNIGDIAKSYGVTQELLCQWNDIPWETRARINIGQSLKVINAPIRVEVDKSEFALSFYFGENLARQFIIAHGKGNGTPVGEATVISKRVDPDIGENLPANLLSMDERWIGLSLLEGRSGIGIHGTKHEDEIPGESSLGCVRMFNQDVVRLYGWLPKGATVKIAA